MRLQPEVRAAGVFGSVAYVQRINTLGGRIPGNFYSIPKFQSVSNYALAIPFQVRLVTLHSSTRMPGSWWQSCSLSRNAATRVPM